MRKEELFNKIKEALAKEFPMATISREIIAQNNARYDGIKVSFGNNFLNHAFNLDKLSEVIKTKQDLKEYTDLIAEEVREEAGIKTVDIDILKNYDSLKTHLCVDVIGIKGNEELLKAVPYERFNSDMAIIPKAVLSNKNLEELDVLPMITVTNDMIKKMNISKEIVLSDAKENADKINPPEIMHVSDYLFGDEHEESAETETHDNSSEPVRFITTQTGICQASMLVNSDALEKVAEQLKGSFYAVPSSIGVIAVPDNKGKNLALRFVAVINETEYMLSDIKVVGELQHYDHHSKKLEPNREFEAKVAKEMEEQKQEKDSVDKPKIDKDKDIETSR